MIPKFRAYHKELKMMFEVLAINFFHKAVTINTDGENYKVCKFDDIILMQSTGLFDKNGVEIFEGDVIVAMSQGVEAIGEVKRRIDGYWLMYPSWQHGEFWHIVENVDTGETGVEVIGNIYELESVEVE